MLYLPLPSSPAVSFRESGLMELLDGTMLDLFRAIGERSFAGLCEWVFRYLVQALEWTLAGKERARVRGCWSRG